MANHERLLAANSDVLSKNQRLRALAAIRPTGGRNGNKIHLCVDGQGVSCLSLKGKRTKKDFIGFAGLANALFSLSP